VPQKSERNETGHSRSPFEFQQCRLLVCTQPASCRAFTMHNRILTNKALPFSNIFGVDLLALLHDQPVLSRKAARRGKRLLSNWSYVRRGQTTVNFEIRAGRVSALIRSQEQSSLRYFDGLAKPAHG